MDTTLAILNCITAIFLLVVMLLLHFDAKRTRRRLDQIERVLGIRRQAR